MALRITNNTMVDRALRDIQFTSQRLDRAQRDISSGSRIHRPSDDPTGTARVQVLKENLALNEQHRRNIGMAKDFLNATETALSQATTIIQRVRELSLQAANGTYVGQDRSSIAQEIGQLRQEINSMGNTQINGRYIFAGFDTLTQPFAAAGDHGTAVPNVGERLEVEIGKGVTVGYNLTSDEVFGPAAGAMTAGNTNLAGVFDRLVASLNTNTDVSNTINNDILGALDSALNRVLNARTEVGGKINRLDFTESRQAEINESLSGLLSKTRDTDVAEASLRLATSQATLQAALSVGARALPMTLVDFLR